MFGHDPALAQDAAAQPTDSMSRNDLVVAAIGGLGVVPIVVASDAAHAEPLASALKAGGLPCAEVTFRTQVAEATLRTLAADPDLLVGAGTILTREQADRAVTAGARFIVSPGLNKGLVRYCQEIGVAVIPGVATASEIQAALDLGLELVKFFPAEPLGGIRMLDALAGPFPGLRFFPTGGIVRDLVATYLGHSAVHAVGGSWMVAQASMMAGQWDEVTRRCAEAVTTVRALR